MIFTRKIGDAKVTNLIEYMGPTHPTSAFQEITPQILEENSKLLTTAHWYSQMERFVIAIQLWIVETEGRVILIDAGVGNFKERVGMTRMHRLNTLTATWLEAAGAAFDRVTDVVMTHLHADHVGWNTVYDEKLGWIPAFPNATYHIPTKDFEYFKTQHEKTPDAAFTDSVLPVLKAGKVAWVNAGDKVAGVLRAEEATGHTPGMLIYWLETGGSPAVFCADIFHHPIQIQAPSVNSGFCILPDLARSTRSAFLEQAAETSALCMPCHFGPPHCGFIRKQSDSYIFEPSFPEANVYMPS